MRKISQLNQAQNRQMMKLAENFKTTDMFKELKIWTRRKMKIEKKETSRAENTVSDWKKINRLDVAEEENSDTEV